jgi:hypothetical protein
MSSTFITSMAESLLSAYQHLMLAKLAERYTPLVELQSAGDVISQDNFEKHVFAMGRVGAEGYFRNKDALSDAEQKEVYRYITRKLATTVLSGEKMEKYVKDILKIS